MIAAVAFRLYIVTYHTFSPIPAEMGGNDSFTRDQCEALVPIVREYLQGEQVSRVVCLPYKFGPETNIKTFELPKR